MQKGAEDHMVTGGTKMKAFLAQVGKGGVSSVKVGIFSEARYDDEDLTPVAAVAAAHEFGVRAEGTAPRFLSVPSFGVGWLRPRTRFLMCSREASTPRRWSLIRAPPRQLAWWHKTPFSARLKRPSPGR